MLLDQLEKAIELLLAQEFDDAEQLLVTLSGESGLTSVDNALKAIVEARFREAETKLREAILEVSEATESSSRTVIEARIYEKIGSEWEVTLVQAGMSKNGNFYPTEVLERDAHLFENALVFDNHVTDEELSRNPARRAGDLLGRMCEVRFTENRLVGRFKVYAGWLREFLKNAWEAGDREILGFSIDALVNHQPRTVEGRQVRHVTAIRSVNSVDVVLHPSAGGRLERILASEEPLQEDYPMEMDKLLEELTKNSQFLDSLAGLLEQKQAAKGPPKEDDEELEEKDKKKKPEYGYPAPVEEQETKMSPEEREKWAEVVQKAKDAGKSSEEAREEALTWLAKARKGEPAQESTSFEGSKFPGSGFYPPKQNYKSGHVPSEIVTPQQLKEMMDRQAAQEKELRALRYQQQLRESLTSSGLPKRNQDLLWELMAGKEFTEAEIAKAVETQRTMVAEQDVTGRVHGNGRARDVQPVFGVDGAEAALAEMMGVVDMYEGGTLPKVPRIAGLREWYLALTDDYDLTGHISPARVTEANVTTSTVTSIVKNVLNKRIVKDFEATQAMRWWEPIVNHVDDPTINQVTEIVTAGFGTLSSVAEGNAYTELDWSDVEETASFTKYGNYVGVTLETFMRDNLNRLRVIPRKLVQSFNLTLASNISSTVFTAGSGAGPTLTATGRALFHTTDKSRNSTDSALSYAAYVTGAIDMAKQTELGSGIQLGLRPKFLLVPPDLVHTAIQIRDSELDPDNAENGVNTVRGSFQVIEVPQWTDANNWYLLANPPEAEIIVMHWYKGLRYPQLYRADSETTGSLFTNDEIRFKIRYWSAIAVVDYRGAWGAIVT